jgi:hypothetical protein
VPRFFRVWLAFPARRIGLVILLGLLGLSALWTQIERVQLKYRRAEAVRTMAPMEVHMLPPNEVLPWFSIGNRHFSADLLFVRAYMYFLEHLFSDRIYGWFDRYVDAITYLDPLNETVYLWAARMVKLGQVIDNAALLRANSYAMKGLKHFPDDWRLYLELGFNLYFEMETDDTVEKKRLQEEGTRYFSIAASLPGAEIDPNFITELHMRQNAYDLALLYAYQLYFDASERERESLRGRISLVEQRAVDRLVTLEEQWKGYFPYVPLRLTPLLGEPIVHRSSGDGEDGKKGEKGS